MFILFEKYFAHGGDNLSDYDLMGFVRDEGDALRWVQEHPEFRAYKFCPYVLLDV